MSRVFKILKQETIYQDQYRSFVRAQIQRDQDTSGHYTYVVKKDVAAAIPLTPDGRTVIVQTYRYPVGEYLWELCLGTFEVGESPEQAVLRELREETGIQATTAIKIGETMPTPGLSVEHTHVFVLPVDEATLQTAKCPDQMDEIIDLRIVSLDEINEMIDRGEFRCGVSLSSISLVHRYLARDKK